MGLLSFLTRKNGKDQPKGISSTNTNNTYHIAISAPHSTRGSSPPPGKALDEFHRARQNGRLSSQPANQSAAVKPYFLGVKTDVIDRPGSAPFDSKVSSARPILSSRSHRESIRGLSFAFAQGSWHKSKHSPEADTLSLPPLARRTSSIFSSGNGSVASKPAGGFVDLLDAQGALRPSDFRSRIQAAGARDYGEDVAERNLGQNGVDVLSPAAQAFYAMSSNDGRTIQTRRVQTSRSVVSLNSAPRPATAKSDVTDPGRPVSRAAPGSVLWRAMNSSDPRRGRSGARPNRSMSLNSSASLPFLREEIHLEETHSRDGSRELRLGSISSTASPLRRPSTSAARRTSQSSNHTAAAHPTHTKSDDRSSSPPAIRRFRAGSSAERPPTQQSLARLSPSWEQFGRGVSTRHSAQSLHKPNLSAETVSRRRNISYVNKIPNILGMVDDGVAGITDDSSDEEAAAAPSSPHLHDYAQSARLATKRPATRDGAFGRQPASRGHPLPTRDGSSLHSRSRSMNSIQAVQHPRLKEITEDMAFHMARMKSWRQASASSARPTTASSDRSEAASRSYHTAKTSVDLSCRSSTPNPNAHNRSHSKSYSVVTSASRPSADMPMGRRASVLTNYTTTQLSQNPCPDPQYDSDNFDGVTTDPSDMDEFIGQRLNEESDEEKLAINHSGGQDLATNLPGLFSCLNNDEAGDSPAEPDMPDTPTMPDEPMAESVGHQPQKEMEDEESQEEIADDEVFHIPMTRRERLRMLGYDYDSDDSDDKINAGQIEAEPKLVLEKQKPELTKSEVTAAVQMRKDAKRVKRSVTRRKTVIAIAVEDDGNVADME